LTLYFILLYRSVDPRHLHSFPTRRSSDLANAPPSTWPSPTGPRTSWPTGRTRWSSSSHRTTSRRCVTRKSWVGPRPTGWPIFARSEEHTSELQSRGHLVCRLLLEKKKRSY